MKSCLLIGAFAASTAFAADPHTVTLNNGVVMPVVAAGSWKYNNDQVGISLAAAFKNGFRHVDTAHDYCADGGSADCKGKSNQQAVGEAFRASGLTRDEVFITTKVPGCGTQGISRNNCGADSVAAAEDNIKELGMGYMDLLLIHFTPFGGCGARNCDVIRDQWTALSEQILATNKTRALGVSNFCQSCLECIKGYGVVPALNQVKYHVGMSADPEGLVSYCKAAGTIVEAYSPLGTNTSELIKGKLVTGIGAAHNKTGVQVSLKWIQQNGATLTTKSSNPVHLQQDLDLFSWDLTAAEMMQLDSATSPAGKPALFC